MVIQQEDISFAFNHTKFTWCSLNNHKNLKITKDILQIHLKAFNQSIVTVLQENILCPVYIIFASQWFQVCSTLLLPFLNHIIQCIIFKLLSHKLDQYILYQMDLFCPISRNNVETNRNNYYQQWCIPKLSRLWFPFLVHNFESRYVDYM